MKFNLVISTDQINKARTKAINSFAKKTSIKGFRKGKAPQKLIASAVGESKILDETIRHALPDVYAKEVKKRNLKPITSPKITPKSLKPNTSWEFEVEIAEAPKVTLGDYKQAIKSKSAKSKIWTPGKAQAKDSDPETKPSQQGQTDPQTEQNQKLDLVFQSLLETSKLNVPSLLVDEEVNKRLSDLLDQVGKLGMSIDDYLKARGETSDTIKTKYNKQSEQSLKLEFILQAVTRDQKIEAGQQEVSDFIKQSQKQPLAKPLSPENKLQLKTILSRRQTIDRLLSFLA